ncbi:hypothetical protein HMPREF1207_05287 [Paenibacillus sp. HGH0039]|nr:hypothetical protein HMPREF1207_05287 [Paenibacillus sp. HGH0039]
MSKHQAIEMYRFHNWANETIFKRLKELPESVYRQEMISMSGLCSTTRIRASGIRAMPKFFFRWPITELTTGGIFRLCCAKSASLPL